MMRVGIVGGGPGGLMTARFIETYSQGKCEITLFEASPRTGGKVVTSRFDKAPVVYEAGVAELYDYSHLGPDPVKELTQALGLKIQQISGPAVIIGDHILRDDRDIEKAFGRKTLDALEDFYNLCRNMFTPEAYYEGHDADDNSSPWADKTYKDVLDSIPDEMARKYVVVAARSDVATEAHLTTALDGLKNVLMDDPAYLRLFSIVGGNESLMRGISDSLQATIRLNTEVKQVSRNEDGTMRVIARHNGVDETHDFDSLVMALPNYWLERVEFVGRDLRLAMEAHLAHYAYPAHYLRVSILFEKPFWRDLVPGDFFMSDAFGGCCLYDEGRRHPCEPYGVLGWLLAGNDAMALSNLDDQSLTRKVLDSLPASLRFGADLMIEAKVHRWVGTINGLPGGNPVHSLSRRHRPDARNFPDMIVAGDYLFDSTLNGVFDSAAYASDLVLAHLRRTVYKDQIGLHVIEGDENAIADKYFENYSGDDSYEDAFEDLFNGQYTVDLIEAVWGRKAPYKVLDCGSANGLTLEVFEDLGVEAWGIENNETIHAQTADKWKSRNLLADVRKLPFPDNSFDFVYATCLCYLPEEQLDEAVREMFRVARVGVVLMGVTIDMTPEVIEDYQLLAGVRTLYTLWEWSEVFVRNGFRLAIADPGVLDEVWRIEQETDEDDWNWYPDKESMRFCFFSKPDVTPRHLSAPTPAEALPRTPIPNSKR